MSAAGDPQTGLVAHHNRPSNCTTQTEATSDSHCNFFFYTSNATIHERPAGVFWFPWGSFDERWSIEVLTSVRRMSVHLFAGLYAYCLSCRLAF